MRSLSLLMITGCLFSIGTDVYASGSVRPEDLRDRWRMIQHQAPDRDIPVSEARFHEIFRGTGNPIQPEEEKFITKSMHDKRVPCGHYDMIEVGGNGAQEFEPIFQNDDVDALKDLMRNPSWDELSNLRFRVSVNHYTGITLYQNGTGTVEQGDCPRRIENLFRFSFINPLELSMVFGAIGCFKHLRINDINTGNITDSDRQRMVDCLLIGHNAEMIQIALEQGLVSLKDLLFGWARSGPNLILFNNRSTTIEGLSGAMSYVMAKDKDYSDWITSTVIEEVGIDATDNYGTTPLMVATERGYTDIAKLLIQAKADVNARDRWGNTPLSIALRNCQPEIARLLEAQLALDNRLMVATRGGDLDGVIESIDGGANIHATDDHGNTALMLAIEHNQPEIARLLIERGALINARDRWGNTPLIFALMYRQPEIVRLLIEKGADATPEQIKTLEANKAPPPAE